MVLTIKATGSARVTVTAGTDRVAADVADAEAEDEAAVLPLGEVGDNVREAVKAVVPEKPKLSAELAEVGNEIDEVALEFNAEFDGVSGEGTAEVTPGAETELLGKTELAVAGSELVTDGELEDTLPMDIVEAMVFDGALATEEGTGRVDVSLATGALNDPDMSSKLFAAVRLVRS